jgi:hypothetical protein
MLAIPNIVLNLMKAIAFNANGTGKQHHELSNQLQNLHTCDHVFRHTSGTSS